MDHHLFEHFLLLRVILLVHHLHSCQQMDQSMSRINPFICFNLFALLGRPFDYFVMLANYLQNQIHQILSLERHYLLNTYLQNHPQGYWRNYLDLVELLVEQVVELVQHLMLPSYRMLALKGLVPMS